MKLLALEFSTATASLALLDDGALAASAAVEAGQRRSQGLFAAAAELLRGAARAEIMPRFRRLASGAVRNKTGPLDLVTDADAERRR